MPYSRTRRQERLSRGRLACLFAAAALALPFVQPTGLLANSDTPRFRGSGAVGDALLVKMRSGTTAGDAAQILSRVQGQEIGSVGENATRVVSVPWMVRGMARKALLADPRVASVEDDAVATAAVVPNDPHWPQQWNARRIRATEAWNATRGVAGITIAIVDTGVDGNHPDLRGRMVRGWDFQNNDGNPYDDDGHGTAVATTAAAAGNDGVGIAGMCWKCKIMPVKVLNGQGHGTHSNIAAGVVWAVDHGADVINMSIAGLSQTSVLAEAVAYAIRKGVIVVAAAGNEGSSHRTYPAAFPGVISVAATNESDRLYSWSNRGRWVTLAAPGCSYSGRPHARWAWLCGTSLASPIVAGTVALMRSLAPRLGRVRLTQMLTGNTQRVRISSLSHGRLDAARAMRSVLAAVPDADPTATPRPSPTATPRPTSTPTPTPRPSPTPTPTTDPTPRQGTHQWRGTLGAADRWDRQTFYIRGHVHVRITWTGNEKLTVWVVHPNGNLFRKVEDDSVYFEMDVMGGQFTFTVQATGSDAGSYSATIEYGIAD
jgi:subtilisin family serine protease